MMSRFKEMIHRRRTLQLLFFLSSLSFSCIDAFQFLSKPPTVELEKTISPYRSNLRNHLESIRPFPPKCGICLIRAQLEQNSEANSNGWGFSFPSSYIAADDSRRGFCNWLLPGKLMVGRYPHGTPWGSKTGSPKPDEARTHINSLISAGINTFVCLQEEVPSQDSTNWPSNEMVPFGNKDGYGFRRYLPDALQAAREAGTPTPRFIHFPIPDLGVPELDKLFPVVHNIAAQIRQGDAVPYVHCWGGRGRAGTIGACLLLTLRAAESQGLGGDADAAAAEALRIVQSAYNTRVGEDGSGSLSPETEEQREFVRRFARRLHAERGGGGGGGLQQASMPSTTAAQ